jgi:hypothetical protein
VIGISKLEWAHRGVPMAVLGGGPSLPADLAVIPDYAIKISVNHHALRLVECPYMVFLDDPIEVPELFQALKDYGGLKISPKLQYSDIELDVPWWDGGFSSSLAVWLASWFRCTQVLLCGMDCYQGERKYFYERAFSHPVFDAPIENHLRAWRPALTECLNPDRIRAVSGPLVELFGKFGA